MGWNSHFALAQSCGMSALSSFCSHFCPPQVCAPTGAGKTNIAVISILHEIGQHFKDDYLHKDEF
ncbi:unnamed protein product [Prunus armeniaca]